ncbi:MAG: deoxyribonuclease IV [Candidatus Verstraetearchaeota archaeon]|nr:deoxyribonuclease IV [Candidatus Verstraetearchaeota archaeon]
MRLGLHISISGTIDKSVDRAYEKGCNTFQIFTRNPRGWRSRELREEEVEAFIEKVKAYGMDPVFGHMPYLPNLASPREDVYKKSVNSLISELNRCWKLKIPYLVTHLGSHLGAGKEEGFRRIINAINFAFSNDKGEVMLLLENTAGTKNSMGGAFEDIQYIIEHIEHADRVGVCFDTCHAFAAGYDLRTREALEETLKKFDEIIGFEKLKIVHLNDSKGDLGSRIDRHEHIGMGRIGEEGFKQILRSRLVEYPLILETPIDKRRSDVENLNKVRELARLK